MAQRHKGGIRALGHGGGQPRSHSPLRPRLARIRTRNPAQHHAGVECAGFEEGAIKGVMLGKGSEATSSTM